MGVASAPRGEQRPRSESVVVGGHQGRRPHQLAPAVIVVAFTGAFATEPALYRVWVTLLFGVLGFVMIMLGISRIPLVLAIVLTPILETNLWVSLQISRGDPAVFVRSPTTLVLILLIIGSVLSPVIESWIRGRT